MAIVPIVTTIIGYVWFVFVTLLHIVQPKKIRNPEDRDDPNKTEHRDVELESNSSPTRPLHCSAPSPSPGPCGDGEENIYENASEFFKKTQL